MQNDSIVSACAAMMKQERPVAALLLCTIDRLRDEQFRKLLTTICDAHPKHWKKMEELLNKLVEGARLPAGTPPGRRRASMQIAAPETSRKIRFA